MQPNRAVERRGFTPLTTSPSYPTVIDEGLYEKYKEKKVFYYLRLFVL